MATQEIAASRLAKSGFTNWQRSARILTTEPVRSVIPADKLDVIDRIADPDLAVLTLERILARDDSGVLAQDLADVESLRSLLIVLGVSEGFGDFLTRHPQTWVDIRKNPIPLDRDHLINLCLSSVEADPAAAAAVPVATGHDLDYWNRLRVAYRTIQLQIAVADLVDEAPLEVVSGALAHAADAVLAAALAVARAEVGEVASQCRLSIIAMGKTGAEELNYVSDVDVIFVVAGDDDDVAVRVGTKLAAKVMQICSSATEEGEIWEVDPGLRPEGKAGALVRTLPSHLGYYERWAATWEFQALLKARFSAGDEELGREYEAGVAEFVWEAAGRENFVADVQAMRKRVVANMSGANQDRNIKLAPGGLRDVEFSVQLLQLVHGRTDPKIRAATTLVALERLAAYGYIGRGVAAELNAAYTFLRKLEHRIQLYRLRRTHHLPSSPEDLRRLGRSVGLFLDPGTELEEVWQAFARDAHRIHERLFYRPLLKAVARLDKGEARLSVAAAGDRLRALGFVDPDRALQHMEELTAGMSRRAAIQRTLLPVMLSWFAESPDPDGAMLAFRQLSDELGGTPWYLRLLRDESVVAERLATIVGTSKYAADLLLRAPEAVAMLAKPEDLRPKPADALEREALALVRRYDEPEKGVAAVRGLRRRELFRLAAGDTLQVTTTAEVAQGLVDVTTATIAGALHAAFHAVTGAHEEDRLIRFLVIAMGRYGGSELAYGSDADVMLAYAPNEGVADAPAQKQALAVANELNRLLALPSADPPLELDTSLRPEGRTGPLVRSIAAYTAYYQKWSSPWEAQALLRARPVCGDPELASQFLALIDPLRYQKAGLDPQNVMEIRRLKARMESERLPRGADPKLHTKLGPGGLSDVEWTIQLLQMENGAKNPALQVTETLMALAALAEEGLVSEEDASLLARAWVFATKIRNATTLATGRASDMVPTSQPVAGTVACLLGYGKQGAADVTQEYQRVSRRARKVVERIFYNQ